MREEKNLPFKLITSLMMSTCKEESDDVSIQSSSKWFSRKPCAVFDDAEWKGVR